jgi:ferredoxin--NADP+ reductase
MTISVAIIGSGPSAFYTAEALIRADVDCQIDMIERLPAPFGLIRYGVAPDHQTTKNVTRNYAKTAQNEKVSFYGNVEVGIDVSLEKLREIYDAVVLAVGAPNDNPLTIPGSDKAGVIGSAALVGWYNGHPDFRDLNPDLDTKAIAVIGNGNVALDIARVFSKNQTELQGSDISYAAAEALANSSIRDVYVFGRRGPIECKFTNVELREMNELEICAPVVDAAQLPDEVGDLGDKREQRLKERNLETFKSFLASDPDGKERRVHFVFYASPVEILGDDKVSGLKLERTEVVDGRAKGTGEMFEIECGLVMPAIGYRSNAVEGVPFNEDWGICVNDEGRVEDGLYAVGWIKRGPTGVISSNRPDGKLVADYIQSDIPADTGKPGRAALEELLSGLEKRIVRYDDWQQIDAKEIANATDPAPRRKFITVNEMIDVLG